MKIKCDDIKTKYDERVNQNEQSTSQLLEYKTH